MACQTAPLGSSRLRPLPGRHLLGSWHQSRADGRWAVGPLGDLGLLSSGAVQGRRGSHRARPSPQSLEPQWLSCPRDTPHTLLSDLEFTVRVLLYALIFLLSVFGNSLIIVVLVLNRRLRTVTNSFLLSLALSDLLLALCCMPFTLVPNLMGTFVFGPAVCKLVAYLMSISVSVSTFSLVAIAIERYSAICNPLQSRVWQTRSHAYRVIASTWLLSLLLMLPYVIYSTTVPTRPGLAQCQHRWPSQPFKQTRADPGSALSPGLQHGGTEPLAPGVEDDGCYVQLARPGGALELSLLGRAGAGQQDRARVNGSQAMLLAKRRVIRMLVVIVVMFFLCWLPIFSANTWRAFAPAAAHRVLSGAPISFIHLLSYTSACANPLIYCFMNRRFRAAFATTFARCRPRRPRRPPPDDDMPTTGASLSKISYTTVSSLGPP
uniref:Gastrin/cholecystokinin type B receptor n=1 Tax=Chrysemys picta bellii TaxID=8478 RepID=A0A8C3HWL9_CHRPI